MVVWCLSPLIFMPSLYFYIHLSPVIFDLITILNLLMISVQVSSNATISKTYYFRGSLDYLCTCIYMHVHVHREMQVYMGSRYRQFACKHCTLYINLSSKSQCVASLQLTTPSQRAVMGSGQLHGITSMCSFMV